MPNIKKNQRCWNCDHFQPYSQGDEPKDAWGECRKMPLNTKYQQDSLYYWEGWWPFIANGLIFWCSEWQRTLDEVKPEPISRPPAWPDVWEEWQPWNVKEPRGIACWTCNHFQPDDPEQSRLGECRKFTVPPVADIDLGGPPIILQGTKSKICGVERWCGAWEKTQNPLGDPPAGFCSDKPPQGARGKELEDMTKAELLEVAEKRGIEVTASANKADILAAIKAGNP